MFPQTAEKNEENGFTLIELLVVIIIIGILAAVAVPAFLNQRQRANDASVVSDVKAVATQIETAFIEKPNAMFVGSGPVNDPSSFQTGTVHIFVGDTAPTSPLTSDTATFSVNLSPGVTIRARPGTVGERYYVIVGQHENGKRYAGDRWLKFDSRLSGLQPGTIHTSEA